MRLKSGLWVSAYVRRLGSIPVAAVVTRRGDADAGAIFIKVNCLDGHAQVWRPALSMSIGENTERRWARAIAVAQPDESAADTYLARQAEFDTDIWIIEVEDREARHFLDDYIVEE